MSRAAKKRARSDAVDEEEQDKPAAAATLLLLSVTINVALAQSSGGEDFIKPSRPDVAEPAAFQPPGVLQIEFGGDVS